MKTHILSNLDNPHELERLYRDVLAGMFVALRVIYTLLYIHDRPTARSLAWAAAFSCVVALFVAAATR